MAVVAVTASANINTLTYTSGADSLSLNNSANVFVRLTIDAQVAADVTKVEAFLPTAFTVNGVNGEVYVVNTSTTVPLVVKLSGENSNTISGPFSKFKVRGDWISLGTGSGANGQTLDFNTLCLTASGVKIDWPPFVQVEVSAGTGALLTTTPTAGATYQVGGAGTTYTVVSAAITAGKGTVTCTGSAAPTINQGMFVKVAGTGDANIGLRYWQKIGSQYVFHVGEAYVTMLNIGGTYKDITPTAYPFKRNLTDCGITIDNGHFFEWSEENHTLYFGSALTGGWVPPNGANIRIPNIHFTGTAIPNATAQSRIRFMSTAGVFDMEVCSFSNRWSIHGSQMWPGDYRIRDVGGLFGSSTVLYMGPSTIDIDGMYNPLDLYQNTRPGPSYSGSTGSFSISNVWGCVQTQAAINLTGIANLDKLGMLRGTVFAKSSAFQYAVKLDEVASTIGADEQQLTVGPIYCNGGPFLIGHCRNIRIFGFYMSDTTTGVESATNTHPWIVDSGGMNGAESVTIERWRLLDGGCPTRNSLVGENTVPANNIAFHDIVIDGENKATSAVWQYGFNSFPGGRQWVGNTRLTSMNTTGSVWGSTNGYILKAPVRVIDALYNPARQITAFSGMFLEGVECTLAGLAGAVDVSPFHLIRTTGNTVGTLHFYPAVINDQLDQISASGGTLGTDFWMTANANIPVTGVTLEYTGAQRIRGVLKAQASATATFNGTSPTTGVTHKLAFRKYGETTWPSFTTVTSGADFLTAWAAMQGYASYTPTIGFEAKYQVITTSSVAGRTLSSTEFKLLDLDSAWVAPEIGYIQIGYTGATENANVAILDYTTPASPVEMDYVTADATGAYIFEYPYDFDGAAVAVKVLARKAGYDESFVLADVYQQGKTVPISLVASESTTDAAVAGIAFTGSTLACAITLDATFATLYQAAQYQAHQSGSMIYPVPVTSNGVQGYTTVYDVTVSTTKKLNGAGSLLMGSKILTSEFTGAVPYTYTGGTFSQATTVPTFSGGTLNIGAAGTYTYTQAAAMILSMTPTAPGTYALGDVVATGQIDLRNTTAHAITVELSTAAAALAITTNNTGGTITVSAPIVTADISITSMPDAGAVPTRLQIFNSTALTAAARANSTAYSAGDIRLRQTGIGTENTAGLYLRCTTAGTSAGTPPTWNTAVGGTTTDGTAVWTTYAVLYYDADPAATSLTDTYIDGEEFLAGEVAGIRFAEMNGSTSFKTYDTEVAITAAGFSALVAEEADAVFATFALDGSAYESTFSPNFTSDYIVLDSNTDFSGKAAFAYYCYTLTTSQGMYEFWGGVTALDEGNIRINTSVLNLYFDESAGFVKQTDDVRIFRSDGTRPALDPTTGGHGIEINWRTPVTAIETGVSGVTAQDITDIATAAALAVVTDGKTLTVPKFLGLK